MNAVMYSSKTDEHPTPQWFFDALNKEFGFTLDPCATHENAKCPTYFTKDDDGLTQSWGGHTVFMNPPYGRTIGQWMRKAYETSLGGATVVCLVPARTDTKWWRDNVGYYDWEAGRQVNHASEVRMVTGRLKFGAAKHTAPFPSAVVIFRPVCLEGRA